MFKRKNRVQTEDIELSQSAQFVPADTANELKISEQRQYIQKALNHLSPDDVIMITLFYLKEQSLQEIAQVVGISAETVKVLTELIDKNQATPLLDEIQEDAGNQNVRDRHQCERLLRPRDAGVKHCALVPAEQPLHPLQSDGIHIPGVAEMQITSSTSQSHGT